MGILRLILALSVVAIHCGGILNIEFVGGQVAVQSFYIISGFYMSLILNEKYIHSNNSYRLFITNRFLRLYPVYWVVLFLTIAACLGVVIISNGSMAPKFENYLNVKPGAFPFTFLVFSNALIFLQDWIMFLGIHPETGNLFLAQNFAATNPPLHSFLFIPQAWTLGLELTFYLIAPFILKRRSSVIVCLIGVSIVLRLILYNYFHLQIDPWTYRFFPTEIMFFLLGYISYKQLYLRIKALVLRKSISYFLLSFILLFTFLFDLMPVTKAAFSPFTYKELIYFLFITLSIPVLFSHFKNSKLDIQIGELSYPVYISHMLIAMIFGNLGLSLLESGFSIAVGTIIFSLLLNKFVAVPIERYRQSRVRKQPLPVNLKYSRSVVISESIEN